MARYVLGKVVIIVILAAFWIPGDGKAVTVSREDAERLADLRVTDVRSVSIAVISKSGDNAETVASVEQRGGVVLDRVDSVDYLSAVLPISQVGAFLAETSLESVSIDQIASGGLEFYPSLNAGLPKSQPRDPSVTAPSSLWADKETPRFLSAPYRFLDDLDATALLKAHPTYDGRGVIVAQVEDFPDFLLPELQTARDIQGHRVPKFSDVINLPDRDANLTLRGGAIGPSAWQWVHLGGARSPVDGIVQENGIAYHVPAGEGTVRIGLLQIPDNVMAEAHVKLPRILGRQKSFAVLWAEGTRTVRLDLNSNHDFTDERPIGEFTQLHQFGTVGSDDPATDVRETIGFAVQKERDSVSFSFGLGEHPSMVAGAVAASRGSNGRIEGVAPGSQLISIYHGYTTSTFAKALVTAFEGPADIVLIETSAVIAHVDSGRSVLAILLNRLIDRFGKPAVVTAGNRPGLGTVSDLAPSNAIVVGASQSRGATYAHWGYVMESARDLHWSSSEGPSATGDMKPDLLAPVNLVSLRPRFRAGEERSGAYTLPVGYTIGDGTSAAAPVAAGALAILISAAKQAGLPYDVASLGKALRYSAAFAPGIEAYQQGAGFLSVQNAWRRLQESAREGPSVDIQVQVPPNDGRESEPASAGRVGFFARDGSTTDPIRTVIVRALRRTGPPGPFPCKLSWLGNEGRVFRGPNEISLPLGQSVPIEFQLRPTMSGVESGILEIIPRGRPTPIKRVPFTLVVPLEFNSANQYTVQADVNLDDPGRRNFFFRVPEGTDALTVKIASGAGVVPGNLYSPTGSWIPPVLLPSPVTGHVATTVRNPAPGVWQLSVLNESEKFYHKLGAGRTPPQPVPVHVEAAIYRVDVTADGNLGHIGLTNGEAPFSGGVSPIPLGTLREIDGDLSPGEQRVFQIVVRAGAEALIAEAELSRASGSPTVNVFLFDCTQGRCIPTPYRRAGSELSKTQVIAGRPRAGLWKIVVDAAGSDHPVTFRYRDLILDPRAGYLVTDDLREFHRTGESWMATAEVWPRSDILDGRRLAVALYAQSEDLKTSYQSKGTLRFDISLNPEQDIAPLGLRIIDLREGTRGPLAKLP